MKILIAEDDNECRRVLNLYLTPLGECDAVEDGALAVECVKRALAQNTHYDLICLDVIMPNLDGHEALKQIRKIETKANCPSDKRAKIIMISAMGDSSNVLGAINETCNAYVVKPVDKAQLYQELYGLGLADDPKH